MLRWFKRKNKSSGTTGGEESTEMPIVSLDRLSARWPHRLRITLIVILTLSALITSVALVAYLYVTKIPLKGETRGRVNILVIGVDEAASLSDTLMLISVDTRSGRELKTAIVSIPRDLWVEVPGFGETKINSAYSLGENHDFPGGGPRLSAKTVQSVFGQPIHYYFALDFAGFRRAIDAVGGVDVTVKEDIVDPFYPDGAGGYAPYSISSGARHLDGAAALKYTRSRFTTSDFDRAARQQQVLLAFKDRLLDKNVLLDGNARDHLLTVYRDHIETDMSVRELLKLGNLLRGLPPDSYTRHVLSTRPESFLDAAYFSGYVLVPRTSTFEQINAMIENIFDDPPRAPAADN